MKKIIAVAAAIAVYALTHPAFAASPVVDVDWVKANTGKSGIVFLDVTGNPNAFMMGHIPGAVFTNYGKDQWRVKKNVMGKTVTGMLPETAYLEKLIGGLGIGNNDHVVVVANGFSAAELGTATRLYWTFKVLGHEEVSILDGGMQAYFQDKNNPLEKGMSKPQPKPFKAKFNDKYLATSQDVEMALKNGTALLDNRPNDQFLGINKSGAVQRAGTLPGALHVPGIWMTKNGGGTLRGASELKALYKAANAPTDGPAISFCNTGHWASLGWFINSEILGNKKTRMYDGSMAEWSIDPAHAMETKVKLK
ncbi:MAG: rhodanese-like domain-containing protein [Rhodospirillales bacterium]|nr:rhodanese-like domain-containing protein [Rhodospirillales bacterium]